MSGWFRMLGEPLGAEESSHVRDYLSGLGLIGDFELQGVSDWPRAQATISDPAWDQRWWDAEQREKERLSTKARQTLGEQELWRALSAALESADSVYHAAAAQAAHSGCSDDGLIRAAAGALSQALYLAELCRIAGAGAQHPFSLKKALFVRGRWPLGIVHRIYYVF